MRGSIGKVASHQGEQIGEDEGRRGWKNAQGGFYLLQRRPARYINSDLPFDQKLDSVLLGHGLNPPRLPLAYLVTTPAFFGYSFNPVRTTISIPLRGSSSSSFSKSSIPSARNTSTFSAPIILPILLHGKATSLRAPWRRFSHLELQPSFGLLRHPSQRSDRDAMESELGRAHGRIRQGGPEDHGGQGVFHSNSFDLLTGSLFRGWYIGLTWGYNTFLSVPQAFYEAWKLYNKKATFYIRPEPLTGSIRREATRASGKCRPCSCATFAPRSWSSAGIGGQGYASGEHSSQNEDSSGGHFSNGKPSKGGIKQLHLRVLKPPKILERDSRQKAREAPPGWTWRLISLLRAWKTRKELRTAASGTTLPPPRTRPSSHLNTMDEFYLLQRAACPRARAMYRWKVLHAVVADVLGFGDSGNVELLASLAKSVGLIGVVVLANVAAAWHFY
ncbi:hypothetical protein BZA05DRAFT_449809 [Tricharina praecox]|uniref:uncharacterized protein n=1 Tax=Tricharina praecox TaxID=43433 RepID=UPI00221F8D21|nr:uncharacterized protein BZA05DRAFT_449809 [Tricharina praecox]KAI5840617.1 hypothetical protein BZA05DRAFT_449809 [Tricharina praecox]